MVWREPTNLPDDCYFYNIMSVISKYEKFPKKWRYFMGLACETVMKTVNDESVARNFFLMQPGVINAVSHNCNFPGCINISYMKTGYSDRYCSIFSKKLRIIMYFA